MQEEDVLNCPTGILLECDLVSRFPERKSEIIRRALRKREQDRLVVAEMKKLTVFYPLAVLKLALTTGILTFVLLWLVSQLAAIGQLYVDAKGLNVAVPLFPSQHIDLGSYVPVSSSLALAANLPNLSVRQVAIISLGVTFAAILDKLVGAFMQKKEAKLFAEREKELAAEIAALKRMQE